MVTMEKTGQKLTDAEDFKLTTVQARLLNILLNPDFLHRNISEKCKAAKISRQTYYTAMQNPHFRKIKREAAKGLIDDDVTSLVHALIKEGKRGSHQCIKMGLQIADIYTEKEEITVKGNWAEQLQRAIEAKKRREKEAIDGSDPTDKR